LHAFGRTKVLRAGPAPLTLVSFGGSHPPPIDMLFTEEEYLRLLPTLKTVLSAGTQELSALLQDEGVRLACPADGRIKSWPSLQEKVVRKGRSPGHITEVSDLVGIRVIVLFEHDLERAAIAVERLFKFRERERTQVRLVPDQFGYASLHYSMLTDWEWMKNLGVSTTKDIPVEVQVRTMAQHVWAAASHALQYKMEEAVPPEIRRSVSRLAALTELIDLELTRIHDQREQYRSRSSQIPNSEPLNVESLERVLSAVWPTEHRIPDEPYSAVLSALARYGIQTPSELGSVLFKHRHTVLEQMAREVLRFKRNLEKEERVGNELIVRRPSHTLHHTFDQRTLERLEKGVFYSHTGLTFTALKREFEDPEPDRTRL